MILFSLVFLNVLLMLALAGLTFAFYSFLKTVSKSTLDNKELPFISVVVPARNEEEKIGRCLKSLLQQDYPHFEIVVIDDRSTDRTGDIIQEIAAGDSRIRFILGKDHLPAGWLGKCNALMQAVAHAEGSWLLFTDADTYHNVNSLRDAISYALTHKSDMVSFVPVQELESFWERVVMPVLLGSFLCGDPFHTVNDPNSSRAYAYGQYILARRSVYMAIGGHGSVRDEIVEDHALGRVVKERGYRVLVADGRELYKVRMYTGLTSLWQGWTKNLYSLIECHLGNLVLVLALINTAALMPFVHLAVVAGMWLAHEPGPYLEQVSLLVSLELLILFVWYQRTTDHYQGVSWKHFFLLPLGSLAVTVLYFHAAYLVLTGTQVAWKGRHYKVNLSKTIEPPLHTSLDPALSTASGETLDLSPTSRD